MKGNSKLTKVILETALELIRIRAELTGELPPMGDVFKEYVDVVRDSVKFINFNEIE